ncbi:topology modulation protein [Alteribacter populi]|uniref:topology modulation protein n=1 Tax=Alteribacter populi TaxID=2011011 RepID=UPI000BBB65D3|nr:topology modulation protein [Alteribacter populi]
MKRIMVLGTSAGAGKSTFAKKLGKITGLDVCHLDRLFWKPGWVKASLEEFTAYQKEVMEKEAWIIEGNYSNTYDIRAEKADTIIYLEVPLTTCLFRVVKRWITNIGKTRDDMGPGCKEKLDWPFIKFIITTYYPRKQKMKERIDRFQSIGNRKEVYWLKGKKQISEFLQEKTKMQTSTF